MITIGSFKYVSDALGSWLDRLGLRKRALAEGERKAVSAYLLALNETELYLGGVDGAKTQADLSRLWISAADAVREHDHGLSQRCFEKARAWASPDDWSEADIATARIGIAEMVKSGEALLVRAG